jgi:hypothetical protein
MAKSFDRQLRIEGRHMRLLATVIPIGAAASLLTYFVTTPQPIWENNKIVHPKNFEAHLSGFPFPYVQTICHGDPTICNSYPDWWGVAVNSLFWAGLLAIGWLVYKKMKHKRSKHK